MAWWLAPTSRWRTAMLERMARPNPSSAVASEDTDKSPRGLVFGLWIPGRSRGTFVYAAWLLHFNLRTGLFHLLLDGLGIGLAHAFLDGLRRAVDEILGLLEAQARDFAHGLDGVDLVLAGGREDHGELGLLLGGRGAGTTAGRGGGDGDGSGGGDAELVFHVLDELRELED